MSDRPYATGYGSVRVDTSQEREQALDAELEVLETQAEIAVRASGSTGLTAAEWGADRALPHQSYSPPFSALRQSGKIVRLKHEKRNRSGVYVTPEHVNGRETLPFVSQADKRALKKAEAHDRTRKAIAGKIHFLYGGDWADVYQATDEIMGLIG